MCLHVGSVAEVIQQDTLSGHSRSACSYLLRNLSCLCKDGFKVIRVSTGFGAFSTPVK